MIPKNFSIALGGGGARGLSHIGVIRYLEENRLIPTAISGTSMGAIIATLYSIGKTSYHMEQILSEMKWLSLIDLDMKK
jgi:NTE family protein